jgi:2'-5' RNA ligase
MSRVVVVLPLAPLRVGESFLVSAWPLHITVVPPFATDASIAELAEAISDAVGSKPELSVLATDDALFGRRHNIPVTLVADDERLSALRNRLIDALRPLAKDPDDRAFSGPEFRPHVTVKGSNRVHRGDQLRLSQVALVDMAPRQSPTGRTVLDAIPLRPMS